MCQYACLPAPNTTIVCTFSRREKRSVDARAVRKAVSSVADRNANGAPFGRSSVSVPKGVVDWEEDRVAVVAEVEAVGAAVDEEDGVNDVVEAEDELVVPEGDAGETGEARVTTLTPVHVAVRPGIKIVLDSLDPTMMREGWFAWQRTVVS